MKKIEQLIDINAIPFRGKRQYKWVRLEPIQRDGKGNWSQRMKCEKTGKLGIRRGIFASF